MKPKFKELILASYEFEVYNPIQTKIVILHTMFFISIFMNILFIFFHLFVTFSYTILYINIFILSLSLYALYLLREKGHYNLAVYIGNGVFFIAFIALPLLKNGEGYTLIWTYFFAPFAISTLGAKRGLIVSIFFITIVLLLTYYGMSLGVNESFGIESYVRFALAHFVMLYIIYAIQNNSEYAERKIEQLREKEKSEIEVLTKLSITDTLTPLYNKRFFEEIFPKQIKKAQENKALLTFFILDIDYFKQYNDTYGHQKGDYTLIQIAKILQKVFYHNNTYLFRIGGEEFAGIFLHKNITETYILSKNILETIREEKIEHQGNPDTKVLTASIGIYVKHFDDDLDFKAIYRLADEALYIAKNNGRNQIKYA